MSALSKQQIAADHCVEVSALLLGELPTCYSKLKISRDLAGIWIEATILNFYYFSCNLIVKVSYSTQ